MEKVKIVVVSGFDGLSGGHIAFDRVEHVEVLRYYSSEVDKYAIQVADYNYPQDTPYRLGDITKIDGVKLLAEIKAEFGDDVIIVLIGGSPCQGFSMAGKLKGSSTACGIDVVSLEQYLDLKEKNFEFDGQSYLFWEFVRLQKEIKPDYFMLENVRVTKKWLPMFNQAMEVEPFRCNSSLVSAQNRDRYYWHNLGEIEQPEDKKLILKDILDSSVSDKFPSHRVEKFEETMKDEVKPSKNGIIQLNQPSFSQQRVYGIDGKSPTIAAGNLGGGKEPCKIQLDKPQRVGELNKGSQGDRVYSTEAKGITLSAQSGGTAGNGNMLIERPYELRSFKEDSVCHHTATATDIKGNESIKRVYAESGKAPAMTTCQGGHREPKVLINESATLGNKAYCMTARYSGAVAWNSCERKQRTMIPTEESSEINPNVYNGVRYRKLTPLECERLQTLPDNYTLVLDENGKQLVSNSQRYKMIGNGWTIDVPAHIFRGIR